MEIINNVTKIVKDDLLVEIKQNSRLSIAAACFSIYAYQELMRQLDDIDELRFIFTSPTFVAEKTKKAQREFYIPRLNREKSLYGTEFEVKLRNEMTQKSIAKECVDWIKNKVQFRSNITNENMSGFLNVQTSESDLSYVPINGFTTVDLGCDRGNNSYYMVNKLDAPLSKEYVKLFDSIWDDETKLQDVTNEIIENISTVYKENSPELIYFLALFNIFNEFLEDISEDELPNESTGFKNSLIWNKLYNFQQDAALAIINKLERYNGCILADSVGLGKTFTALAVIKYYENRNKSVLVLCPKKLEYNWNTFKDKYVNNPIAADRLNYDVLFHTDLARETGRSNGLDISRLNWGNYDLIIIDESHNFRNGGEYSGDDGLKENRYLKLLNKVIRAGVKTKVLMLSATPVNNRFYDLRNQLALAYEGYSENIDDKLNTEKSIDDIFKAAQKAFNVWSKMEPSKRSTESLLSMLSFDFFELLDSVTIARSRKHIEKYYNTEEIGKFPERLKPVSLRPSLTTLKDAINYNQIYECLMQLNLMVYTPSNFIFDSKLEKYMGLNHKNENNLTQMGREEGIRRLMSINLLKRLESSVNSFKLTLKRIQHLINSTIESIENYDANAEVDIKIDDEADFDYDDQNTDLFTVGKKVHIALRDIDYVTWLKYLKADSETLELLVLMIDDIQPEHDQKLQTLLEMIEKKINHPINENNNKIIVFTAYSDTAEYLYTNVSHFVKDKFDLDTAMITGNVEGRTTIPKLRVDLNTVLTCFSPISKDKQLLMPDNPACIDVLIATDCISEGQNLQDCDYLINYDIHWNPVRIIQRFGRIDRIGSHNAVIQLVNFWPDLTLDDYINLKSRVESRMKISVMTSTGDDDLINQEEKGDLEYRKQQLERLQNEVVDIEEMQSGVSIMDLGLNEFRLDLLEFIKQHPDIERSPNGMHAVVKHTKDAPPGVIYILKNINKEVNIDNQNRLHPFYMVYINDNSEVICNHLAPKTMLDLMRLLCRGEKEPDQELCRIFNAETKDGKNMKKYSELLQNAVASIIEVKEQNDIDSLFGSGSTTALLSNVRGLDDFELICFIVIK